jgi:uncharacterized protein YndB with AHSA1/START domain
VTEVRIDVDLAHPQELVWRALTDAAVINSWFPNTGFVATEEGRFTVRPDGVVGFDGTVDGEIVSVEPPDRLVIRLEAPRLHTLMTVTLRPTELGCRLSVSQRGFLGTQGTMRRRTLQRTYRELVERRLIPAIERLAGAETPAVETDDSPVRETKRNTAGPFLRVPRQPTGNRSEPPRSASAPGLASHVRAPASAPGVSPIPGFGAAVLGAQTTPRPIGVVRADEVARMAEAPPPASPSPASQASGSPSSASPSLVSASSASPPTAPLPPAPLSAAQPPPAPLSCARPGAVAPGVVPPGIEAGPLASEAGEPPARHRSTVDRTAAGRVHAAVDMVAAGVTVGACGARRQLVRLGAWLSGVPRWPAERRSQAVAGLAALLLLIALVALLLAKATMPRPADPPQVGGGPREPGQANVPAQQPVPNNNPPATNAAASGAAQPVAGSASPSAPVSVVAPVSKLVGAYRTEQQYVSGYEASITITNPTTSPVNGWSATLRMPLLTLTVYDVQNADLAQTGTNVTFTPLDATRSIAPGESIVVRFQVRGVGEPNRCAVDGNTCAGIPE